ncbi:hypothetical protein ACF073_23780 [Streptomyces sp. NPDC015171]|uniref:hypothetical protein n=1 Tax=Streptomyces sp. NPDC015171 TaxID=3364945 RepID=UPI0036F5867C
MIRLEARALSPGGGGNPPGSAPPRGSQVLVLDAARAVCAEQAAAAAAAATVTAPASATATATASATAERAGVGVGAFYAPQSRRSGSSAVASTTGPYART